MSISAWDSLGMVQSREWENDLDDIQKSNPNPQILLQEGTVGEGVLAIQ